MPTRIKVMLQEEFLLSVTFLWLEFEPRLFSHSDNQQKKMSQAVSEHSICPLMS